MTSTAADVPAAKPNVKVLITRDQIAARVAELGRQISQDYAGESILLIGVLKGACLFLSDLARSISLDATFDFIAVSSYGADKTSSGAVKLVKDVDGPLQGRNVIVVEDILDTGFTLTYLCQLLRASQPKSL